MRESQEIFHCCKGYQDPKKYDISATILSIMHLQACSDFGHYVRFPILSVFSFLLLVQNIYQSIKSTCKLLLASIFATFSFWQCFALLAFSYHSDSSVFTMEFPRCKHFLLKVCLNSCSRRKLIRSDKRDSHRMCLQQLGYNKTVQVARVCSVGVYTVSVCIVVVGGAAFPPAHRCIVTCSPCTTLI